MYSDTTVVTFPGIFGDFVFHLNKVAFTLFGKLEVRWYGIIITCGILFAFLYAIRRGKRNEGVVSDDVMDVGLATVLCGVIGARAYYVLTTLDTHNYESFYDVIAIWEGGLAIYGGIIGGCLGILAVCYLKKLRWRKLFDMIAPGVVIAQAMGRWGNFFNGEAYGYAIGETTRFYFFNKEFILSSGEGSFFNTFRMGLSNGFSTSSAMTYYHPTFLYESVWNLLGFVLLNLFYKRKKFDGQIALMYFAWYGFGRMFIEGLRTDSLYIPGTTLRISQCLGLACFLVSIGLLIFFLIRHRGQPSVFATANEAPADFSEALEAEKAEASELTEALEEEKMEARESIEEDGREEAAEPTENEATDAQSAEETITDREAMPENEEERKNGFEN